MAAVAERLVKGIRRMASAITIMKRVPVSVNGFLENATTRAIPITAPGMISGIMDIVSIALLNRLFLLTTRYAIKTAITIITARVSALTINVFPTDRISIFSSAF